MNENQARWDREQEQRLKRQDELQEIAERAVEDMFDSVDVYEDLSEAEWDYLTERVKELL